LCRLLLRRRRLLLLRLRRLLLLRLRRLLLLRLLLLLSVRCSGSDDGRCTDAELDAVGGQCRRGTEMAGHRRTPLLRMTLSRTRPVPRLRGTIDGRSAAGFVPLSSSARAAAMARRLLDLAARRSARGRG